MSDKNNIVSSNSSIRLSQEIQINQERIHNLRISSITDICMVVIFIMGLGIIIYYVVVSLHIK
jgi:hypothetical protein